MRYRLTPSPKKNRAQVMTPPGLARRLVELVTPHGGAWLELGCGSGRLAQACLDLGSPGTYIGIECDPRLLDQCSPDPRAHFVPGDVLSPSGMADLLEGQTFSRVIGNPPYGMQAMDQVGQRRFAALCPGIAQIMHWVQQDLYFVLESLARLQRPGEAAFIVGAPIAQDVRLMAFREQLMAAASEIECYELPNDAFDKGAEVQSYLLVARFGASRLKRVRLGRMQGAELEIVNERWIGADQASRRLDIGFHEFEALSDALHRRSGSRPLSEMGASIVRGSRTRSQFDDLEIAHFHTSHFPPNQSEVHFDDDRDHGFQVARAGDILLPRVGTRCLDRQALVTKGRRHYTEAVYRLRVPKRSQTAVVDWVFSDAGTRWRQAAAKGSCAKHVTVASLMAMPVPSTNRSNV